MMEVPALEKVLRRVFWLALIGATLPVISLNLGETLADLAPRCAPIGGILGGLTGLAFSVSEKGATIGAWIGGLLGGDVFLDGLFIPGLPVVWIYLWLLPLYLFLGSSVGSMVGAIIGWTINALRRRSHER